MGDTPGSRGSCSSAPRRTRPGRGKWADGPWIHQTTLVWTLGGLETEDMPPNRYAPSPVGPQVLTHLRQHVAGSMFPSTAVCPVLCTPLQVIVPYLTHTHTQERRRVVEAWPLRTGCMLLPAYPTHLSEGLLPGGRTVPALLSEEHEAPQTNDFQRGEDVRGGRRAETREDHCG